MERHSAIYPERHTYGKYDASNIIGYLNEEEVPEYLPDGAESPVTGYRYTGTEKDGGTIMPCANPDSYPEVVNAIIRSRFSESDEMAIHRHYANDKDAYGDEWRQYSDFCEAAKVLAKRWLCIE